MLNENSSDGANADSSKNGKVTTSSQTIAKPNVGCQGLSVSLNDTIYPILFVYAKNGKIKVLDCQLAKQLNDKMLNDGWAHTKTIDPCLLLENLHNCRDININSEIKNLSKK